MKEHILPKQASEITEEQFYQLFESQHWGCVKRKDWAYYHHKKITIGKMIELIRERNQIDIYTVDDVWKVQLFDLSVAANDNISCVWEEDGRELCDVLWEAVKVCTKE